MRYKAGWLYFLLEQKIESGPNGIRTLRHQSAQTEHPYNFDYYINHNTKTSPFTNDFLIQPHTPVIPDAKVTRHSRHRSIIHIMQTNILLNRRNIIIQGGLPISSSGFALFSLLLQKGVTFCLLFSTPLLCIRLSLCCIIYG